MQELHTEQVRMDVQDTNFVTIETLRWHHVSLSPQCGTEIILKNLLYLDSTELVP